MVFLYKFAPPSAFFSADAYFILLVGQATNFGSNFTLSFSYSASNPQANPVAFTSKIHPESDPC